MYEFNNQFIKHCENGRFDEATQMIENESEYFDFKKVFNYVCDNNYLELAKKIMLKSCYLKRDYNSVLEKACRNGYLEMAKWAFNSEWGKLKKWFKCDSYTNCFSTACYNNHLEVAKWLMSTDIKDEININGVYNWNFARACSLNNLSIAQYLLELDPSLIITEGQKALYSCCAENQFNSAKWLYELNPNNHIFFIDDKYPNNPFPNVCKHGNLEFAKWLLKINPNINISANDEFAFRLACKYGHLPVVQWLLSIKPDINIYAENDFAFKMACHTHKLLVAKFLCEMDPTKYSITLSKKNKIFKREIFKFYELNKLIIGLNIKNYLKLMDVSLIFSIRNYIQT